MNTIRSIFVLVCTSIFAFCFLTAAQADSHQQDSATIASEIVMLDQAVDKGDANGSVAYDTPDYVHYNEKGVETIRSKAQDLAQSTEDISKFSNVSQRSTITNITYDKKGGAIVTVSSTFSAAATVNGSPHILTGQGIDREYWIESQGVWLVKIDRDIIYTMSIDGRLLVSS